MQLNDAILSATKGPDLQTGLSKWFDRQPNETLPDAEMRWLIERGVTPSTLPDMWSSYISRIFPQTTGQALNDKKLFFWSEMIPGPKEILMAQEIKDMIADRVPVELQYEDDTDLWESQIP